MKRKLFYLVGIPVLTLLFAAIFVFVLNGCATTSAAKKSSNPLFDKLDPVITKTLDKLSEKLPPRTRVALLPPGCTDRGAAGYVFDELYIKFIDANYTMTDRADIDKAIAEIDFGMSGMVSDATAASLGKILGAEVIVFGDMPEFGTDRARVVFRALKVETGEMLGISSERY